MTARASDPGNSQSTTPAKLLILRGGSRSLYLSSTVGLQRAFQGISHTWYPYSTMKGTRISILKIAKIGVNIREICKSVKVEKRVLFLSENS